MQSEQEHNHTWRVDTAALLSKRPEVKFHCTDTFICGEQRKERYSGDKYASYLDRKYVNTAPLPRGEYRAQQS